MTRPAGCVARSVCLGHFLLGSIADPITLGQRWPKEVSQRPKGEVYKTDAHDRYAFELHPFGLAQFL